MGELIPRDWVLKNLLFDVDRDVVRAAPTVDAEPVRHGRWETKVCITKSDWGVIDHREEVCSECGKGQIGISKFCPNCGAKMMDGGKQDAE